MSESKAKNRRRFSCEFKTKVVLELLKGECSLSQMSARHGIKDTVLSRWKQEFLERAPLLFAGSGSESEHRLAELEHRLAAQAEEIAILKKALSRSAKTSGSGS
jgi:putative transposase